MSIGICEAEIFLVELCVFGACFQAVQEIQFRIATGGREDQIAVFIRFRLARFQFLRQLRRNRNLAFLVRLGSPMSIGVVRKS